MPRETSMAAPVSFIRWFAGALSDKPLPVSIVSTPEALTSARRANNPVASWTTVDRQLSRLKARQHLLPQPFLQRRKSIRQGFANVLVDISLPLGKNLLPPRCLGLMLRSPDGWICA